MKGKILVTGGTGFIGSHTTVELQQAGYEVVIIDDLGNSNVAPSSLKGTAPTALWSANSLRTIQALVVSSILLQAKRWARVSKSPSCTTAIISIFCLTYWS